MLSGPKIVFIHVPKTAGGTIWDALKRSGIHRGKSHRDVRSWKEQLGGEWHDCESFAVVRHPLDRLVSIFAFSRQWAREDRKDSLSIEQFRLWVKEGTPLAQRYRLPADHNAGGRRRCVHAPQCEWLLDDGGELGVDHLLRFESLDRDWARLQSRLGSGSVALARRNQSERHARWQAYYDEETEALSRSYYAQDFAMLGYDKVEGP